MATGKSAGKPSDEETDRSIDVNTIVDHLQADAFHDFEYEQLIPRYQQQWRRQNRMEGAVF